MILLLLLDGVGVNSLLELESDKKKFALELEKILYLVPIWYLSSTYLVPIWYLSDTYLIPI